MGGTRDAAHHPTVPTTAPQRTTGPDFSSVQGGRCPKPGEPWLGSQTTPLPQPDPPGPLMLHPALRLRCHPSVSTPHSHHEPILLPGTLGTEPPHAAFPLLGASPRMCQKTSSGFFAPKIVPLRVFLSQTGPSKIFQAFVPSSLTLNPKSTSELCRFGGQRAFRIESRGSARPPLPGSGPCLLPLSLRPHSTRQPQESL